MQSNGSGYVFVDKRDAGLTANVILRKTYFLLSLTILFSAITAISTLMGFIPVVSPGITLVGIFGLMFLTQALSNTKWALLSVFAFTGFMGCSLAPLLAYYLTQYTNGAEIIGVSLIGTGVIFTALSLYTIISRKDFSYMAGFLFVAICVAFLASVVSIFVQIEIISLLVSCAFILISSGLILFRTSQIIKGGEDNYIMATIALYVSIFNLLVSLLRILSFFGGSRRN